MKIAETMNIAKAVLLIGYEVLKIKWVGREGTTSKGIDLQLGNIGILLSSVKRRNSDIKQLRNFLLYNCSLLLNFKSFCC